MLDEMKLLLDLDETDLDNKLNLLLNSTKARLKMLLGGIDPPDEMEHIIVEVAIIRFNRIGSEGISNHTVEGESLSYNENDFAGFADEIQAFLDSQETSRKGRVRFL